MLLRLTLTLPFLLLAAPAFAQVAASDPTLAPSGTYVSDPEHTGLTFRVMLYGLSNYTGRLTYVGATLDWTRGPAGLHPHRHRAQRQRGRGPMRATAISTA